jgi:hypothetical protein
MGEDDNKKITPHSGDIARVLRERERLDQLIEQMVLPSTCIKWVISEVGPGFKNTTIWLSL